MLNCWKSQTGLLSTKYWVLLVSMKETLMRDTFSIFKTEIFLRPRKLVSTCWCTIVLIRPPVIIWNKAMTLQYTLKSEEVTMATVILMLENGEYSIKFECCPQNLKLCLLFSIFVIVTIAALQCTLEKVREWNVRFMARFLLRWNKHTNLLSFMWMISGPLKWSPLKSSCSILPEALVNVMNVSVTTSSVTGLTFNTANLCASWTLNFLNDDAFSSWWERILSMLSLHCISGTAEIWEINSSIYWNHSLLVPFLILMRESKENKEPEAVAVRSKMNIK